MSSSNKLDQAYETLQLPKSATEAEISSAYKKLAVKHHPGNNNVQTELVNVEVYTLCYF